MCYVEHMQEKVCVVDLLQGGTEGSYELSGELLDKAHGVAEERYLSLRKRRLVVGSRVAKSLSSTNTSAPEIALSKVDLPAFV
jgi:hypothetical protein